MPEETAEKITALPEQYKLYRRVMVRRDDPTDVEMVRQSDKNYRAFDFSGNAVVMDWGANIGAFAVRALSHTPKISCYIGIEPHPDNYAVLKHNVGKDIRSLLLQGAVTTPERSANNTVLLRLTRSKQRSCSGSVKLGTHRKGENFWVEAYCYRTLFNMFQPTHLKIDIEGEEEAILEDCDWTLPPSVKQLAVEFHGERMAKRYLEYGLNRLHEQGFHVAQESINYVHIARDNPKAKFLDYHGDSVPYRNIWGIDCLFKRK